MKNNKKQKRAYRILFYSLMVAIIVGCGVALDKINKLPFDDQGEEVSYVKAGDIATFKLEGHAETNEEKVGFNLIVGILVPISWNARVNTSMTYTAPGMNVEDSPLILVPDSELPKNKNLSWPELLMNEFGTLSNVLNDMEWVVYRTTAEKVPNGTTNFVVTIKCKTGPKNLKTHIGFFINHTDDGYSKDKDHFAITESECFEVVEGEGPVTDFCDMHYNKVEPLAALQDDFVTFSFQGGVQSDNALTSSKEDIYMEATAYTDNGNKYPVTEKNEKTLMKKEGKYGETYALTLWPAGFFGIPDGETITRIDYVFCNQSRTIVITKSDDEGEILEEGEEGEPFSSYLQCE